MLELSVLLLIVLILAYPLGKYLAQVMQNQPLKSDVLFHWIERPIYAMLGTNPQQGMNVKSYILSFICSCFFLGLVVFILLLTQQSLPLNPHHAPNMSWDLALHTMISFLTNTNQQHYSGQVQLSYLSQMVAIVGLQVITPMMGLAMVVATLRALFQQPLICSQDQVQINNTIQSVDQINVGNYWADLIRPTLRFLLPLCLLWSLLLNSQGVPATFQAGPQIQVMDQSSELVTQQIPLGPVAPMVAIKQLGSNGGGWYGPNSSTPLENPTPLSNLFEMIAILLIPVSVIFMLGFFTRKMRFAVLVFASMLLMSLVSAASALWSESLFTTTMQSIVMEGKELRFAEHSSAIWAAITTQVNNGSVNMMHDSAAPLTGLIALMNMLINAIWGGIGCGLQQFMIYLFLAVFIAGLMTGRSPALFGRKIEAGEIKLLAILMILQPLVILSFTAISLFIPEITGNSNLQYHAVSQVLYEYVSAFANNGSGFEGLADNSIWWNITTSITLLLGRFPTLIIPLLIAVRLAAKPAMAQSEGSLRIETPTFALTLIAIVLMLTLLQFMPVLVLGPIADQLLWLQG
ncbi:MULTISPECIES: potassium-transporting ATPase subunit KdpA [unclassified Acinetobacter]|uniref:potassium-transporting ATPase subunit KdpA n=1 Tax=unclassified Acinetobacter TaxID=196816 RepID=UPI0029341B21|nr:MULTISPECIES: potassium-transporting ATPase subunit KdpA [unclassified Acinetobacter]WOE31548.1 potassium-transporting ATPase subunit KdpA [Acinetobacter sp. SAAs470]WOE39744.1 potassium-transporting ATPase subunit KdpA [Acinetobacter sp. SAAs474]